MEPLSTTPGPKPVTAVPGLTPKSPLTTVAPVLVTVEAPRTAKLSAAPSGTTTAVADRDVARSPKRINTAADAAADLRACLCCVEVFRICIRSDLAAPVLRIDALNTCFH